MKGRAIAVATSSVVHASVVLAATMTILNRVYPMDPDLQTAVSVLILWFYRAVLEPLGSLLAARFKHPPRSTP